MEASTDETGEDKKPEIKCEPKEEKEGKETPNDSSTNTESKKKSRRTHLTLLKTVFIISLYICKAKQNPAI